MSTLFKKKGAPKRRRRRQEASEGASDEDDALTTPALAEIRAEQRGRRRAGGIPPEKLATRAGGPVQAAGTEAKAAAEASSEPGAPKTLTMTQFMGTSSSNLTVEMQHENLMKAYIEKKLGGQKRKASDAATPEDQLYTLPEHLRVQKQQKLDGEKDKRGETIDAETDGAGGPLAWGSGIAEVALPIEEKRRNVEATERAIKALKELQEKGASDPLAVRSEDGNVSVNYSKHRREYAQEIRLLSERAAKARNDQEEESGGKRKPERAARPGSRATDNRVVGQFLKANRGR
eukprot:scaffold47_cov258-Pinguiococcus_pyrenoidosus.AAC.19